MADEKKKSIFKKIGDALSSKDEKEELAKVQAELEATKKKAAVEEANRLRVEQAEKLKAAAEARAAEFEARKKEAEAKAAAAAIIAEHTVTNDDTLSGIALKYYKHATEPYWRFIYEINKDVIGGNPGILRPGIVLKIMTLPESLKD